MYHKIFRFKLRGITDFLLMYHKIIKGDNLKAQVSINKQKNNVILKRQKTKNKKNKKEKITTNTCMNEQECNRVL